MACIYMTVGIYGQVNTPQREEKGEERERERERERGRERWKGRKEGSLVDQAATALRV